MARGKRRAPGNRGAAQNAAGWLLPACADARASLYQVGAVTDSTIVLVITVSAKAVALIRKSPLLQLFNEVRPYAFLGTP